MASLLTPLAPAIEFVRTTTGLPSDVPDELAVALLVVPLFSLLAWAWSKRYYFVRFPRILPVHVSPWYRSCPSTESAARRPCYRRHFSDFEQFAGSTKAERTRLFVCLFVCVSNTVRDTARSLHIALREQCDLSERSFVYQQKPINDYLINVRN